MQILAVFITFLKRHQLLVYILCKTPALSEHWNWLEPRWQAWLYWTNNRNASGWPWNNLWCSSLSSFWCQTLRKKEVHAWKKHLLKNLKFSEIFYVSHARVSVHISIFWTTSHWCQHLWRLEYGSKAGTWLMFSDSKEQLSFFQKT